MRTRYACVRMKEKKKRRVWGRGGTGHDLKLQLYLRSIVEVVLWCGHAWLPQELVPLQQRELWSVWSYRLWKRKNVLKNQQHRVCVYYYFTKPDIEKQEHSIAELQYFVERAQHTAGIHPLTLFGHLCTEKTWVSSGVIKKELHDDGRFPYQWGDTVSFLLGCEHASFLDVNASMIRRQEPGG